MLWAFDSHCVECHNTTLRKDMPAWISGKPTDKDGQYTDLGLLVNYTTPENSLFLRAPLARAAGGLELCSKVSFEDKTDPIDVYETDRRYWESFWVK